MTSEKMWIVVEDEKILAVSSHQIEDGFDVEFEELEYDLAAYRYVEDKILYDFNAHLDFVKMLKEQELSDASDESIRAGFEFEISPDNLAIIPFDETGQKNLQATIQLFEKGIIHSIPWTVNRIGGSADRVILTAEMSEGIALSAMLHTHVNISRFRDQLMPIVKSATTIEDVENVTWDDSNVNFRGFPTVYECKNFLENKKIDIGDLKL